MAPEQPKDRLERIEDMVSDMHQEIMGEMGTDRIGLRGDVRDLKRDRQDHAAQLQELKERVSVLEAAPGKEAIDKDKIAKAHGALRLVHAQSAIVGAAAAEAINALTRLFGGHH